MLENCYKWLKINNLLEGDRRGVCRVGLGGGLGEGFKSYFKVVSKNNNNNIIVSKEESSKIYLV